MNIINKVREWLKGRKTYLTALGTLITTLIAFSDGQLTVFQAINGVLIAAGLSSIRAAISKVAGVLNQKDVGSATPAQ